jgi:hypothetical protein
VNQNFVDELKIIGLLTMAQIKPEYESH